MSESWLCVQRFCVRSAFFVFVFLALAHFTLLSSFSIAMGAQNAKNDLETYRAGYPDEVDDEDANENLRFYKNERPSIPDGVYIFFFFFPSACLMYPSGDFIDEIHKKWLGKYSLLERHHGYIQWLFPIREHGMNYQSQKLQKHEIEAIKADPACLERVLKSYELMLDFYGIRLKDRQTGLFSVSPGKAEKISKRIFRR